MGPPPSRELIEWVTATIGGPSGLSPCGWPQGPSRVWRLQGADGTQYYLKQYDMERKRTQEVFAYEEWISRLREPSAEGPAVRLPELVARSDHSLRAVILSEVPGEVVSRAPLGEDEGIELHRDAGAFIRRLHDLPAVDDDPIPLREAIPLRLAVWLERGGDRLSSEEGALARRLIGDGSLFAQDTRVPCHRDYHCRNWVLDRAETPPRLGVIDFEHARLDHPLIDFVRVRERALPRYPHWFEAFTEGYGLTIDEGIERKLRAFAALHAVGCVVWGTDHGDEEFVRTGHDQLERLGGAGIV